MFLRQKYFLGSLVAVMALATVMLVGTSTTASANPKYASIVVNANTGKVLHARYPDKILYPASLTKMMTLYMTFEALDRGRLTLSKRLPVSRHAASMEPSKINLRAGQSIRTKDAILSLVTKSANDSAVVLAEALGGSEDRFARLMTARARDLGMSRTTFRNASGLPDRRQRSTARDIAKLSMALHRDYPHYYHYFKTQTFRYNGVTYRSHNRLMRSYEGMDGLKTGYIRASGFNLASSVERGGQRIVAVVFGGRTAKSRNTHMAKLLDKGFRELGMSRIASRSNTVLTGMIVPQRKPGTIVNVTVARSQAPIPPQLPDSRLASISPEAGDAIGDAAFDDRDVSDSLRMKAMMTARALLTGEEADASLTQLAYAVDPTQDRRWAIQVGTFTSRSATDRKLSQVQASLGGMLGKGQSLIMPLRSRDGGIMFRARVINLDAGAAEQACNILPDCFVLMMQ